MARSENVTYEEIVKAVKCSEYVPIYYLMGEESYYIDKISEFIVDNALTESEKDFNLTVLYGADTNIDEIINASKRYPMGAKYQVVLVKEFQQVENKDRLIYYVENPVRSTILILCHKNGSLDRRKKIATSIQSHGIIFESKRLYDNQLPGFVVSYLRRRSVVGEEEAIQMICDYIGSDLSRISSELDKLLLTLPIGSRITRKYVEDRIGVSKEFNNFELLSAIVEKDIYKANRILKYFDGKPRSFSIQQTISVLFNFFSNLMLAYYSPQKTDDQIAEWLSIPRWQVTRNVAPAMKKYTGVKVMQIIQKIREVDAKSKGIENSNVKPGDLLMELIYYILH